VEYTFDVTVAESCNDYIKKNNNIVWYLDNTPYRNEVVNGQISYGWDRFVAAIDALGAYPDAGQVKYEAGTLPEGFGVGSKHEIRWEWIMNENESGEYVYDTGDDNIPDHTQDQFDTFMDNLNVSLVITITATQVD
jgi:hypothetical protein